MITKKNKKKLLVVTLTLIILAICFGCFFPLCSYKDYYSSGNSEIAIETKPYNCNEDANGTLKELPSYNQGSEKLWQVDVRGRDISDLDLSNRLEDLLHADFDSRTKWPSSLPNQFNPQSIMDIGKNPGLNLRKLHANGITGKGVSIAIIDQTILTSHEEYKDRLKFYEELHDETPEEASMHGTAVSSIALGKTVGVAPEANLYYIAEAHGKTTLLSLIDDKYFYDFTYLAKSVDRILEVNKTLPNDKKIRVISISVGWNPSQKGFKEIDDAVKRAQKEGILVLCANEVSDNRYYNYNITGLGRNVLDDPDNINSYKPGLLWSKDFYNGSKWDDDDRTKKTKKTLMVPMDSKCIASFTGNSDYFFNNEGGLSWVMPYATGLYALCCQVKPDITPEEFWEEAISTGDVINVKNGEKDYKLGTIINPERLITKLKNE